MFIQNTTLPEIRLITPKRFSDERGFFSETWNERSFRRDVADVTFCQDNQSFSAKRGTVRGLHFQKSPFAQGKLVRVVRGSIYDLAVDIRPSSSTFGQHIAVTLSAEDGGQLWIPPGFLHGFCTLENDTEVFYKVTAYYSAEHDAGVLWNDEALSIDWPIDPATAIVSEKDRRLPQWRDLRP
jgi:dTDP-4-dehydrorhamnose 3,5-epimerase